MGFCFLSVHSSPLPPTAHTKLCMTFWFQAPVLQFFPPCAGKKLKCKIISPETIILFWEHGKERYRDEFFFSLKKEGGARGHKAHPLLLHEPLRFLKKNNSY